MSENNNDTFLSRIFGMNSVYTQAGYGDNMIGFDNDQEETTTRDGPDKDIEMNEMSEVAINKNLKQKSQQKSLVDSESDYDSDIDENLFNDLHKNQSTSYNPMNSIDSINSAIPNSSAAANKKSRKIVSNLSEIDELNDSFEESDFDPESLLLNQKNQESPSPPHLSDIPNASAVPNTPKINEFDIQGKLLNKINNIKNNTFIKNQLPTYESFKKPKQPKSKSNFKFRLNNRERALWLWANIENLDIFLQDLYNYYLGNGFQIILISRVIDLLTLLFVIWFSSYLTLCIDFTKIPHSNKLGDVKVDKCFTNISFGKKFLFFGVGAYLVLRIIQLYYECLKLIEIKNFYNCLLGIKDDELQTISWQSIVGKIINLKQQNALTSNNNFNSSNKPTSKVKIDALNIANRIMRKENYMIALFNKKILDLSLPIPIIGSKVQILTKTLEWNLNLCILNFIFNEQGQIKSMFLKEQYRNKLSLELRKRFMLAGILNLFLSPFIVTYFILLYFFRYFNEYKSKPSLISSRQYTPLAEWKLREFNELYHLFQKRLNLSVPAATNYVDQFPNFKKNILLKFISFISGSFASVLGIYSIFDPENFLNFEITKDRTVLFYISIFGTIWALARSSLPEENLVFDPEASIRYLSQFTHYLPNEWEGKLHTEEVKFEFCKIFNLRILVLFNELASLILTPFILWFKLSQNSTKIIDFFREFSIHVDGLGYVCTFAMFNFEKKNKLKFNKSVRPTDDGLRENYYHDDKMIKSYLYFMESYGQNENQSLQQKIQNNQQQYQNQQHLQNSQLQTQLRQRNNLNNSIYPESMLNSKWQPKPFSDQNQNQNQNHTPINSIYLDKKNNHSQVNSSLGESFQVNYKFDDSTKEDDEAQTGGVLGLLNQFYKHADIGR